jgi:hypothetical protein
MELELAGPAETTRGLTAGQGYASEARPAADR